MEIVPFEPDMAEGIRRLYNELIEPVPECYPATSARFESVEALGHKRLHDEQLMVARSEDGGVAGFVHVGLALPAEEDDLPRGEPAAIRFLSCRVGERRVGQALLEWVERWARGKGRSEVVAWHAGLRYPFYHFGWAHLSERIGHVRALFGMNGYEEYDAEVFLTWRDYEPPEVVRPKLEFDLRLDWREGPLGEKLTVEAMDGPKSLGHCTIDWGQHSRPGAKEWCYCNSLEVKDELQGKRLGRFLLGTALAAMKEKGCRHAAISTNGTNWRAQLMYTNLGYRFADQTYSFKKELGE